MKLEGNYIFLLFIVSNINMEGKWEECWEQVNSEVLSTLQPAKITHSKQSFWIFKTGLQTYPFYRNYSVSLYITSGTSLMAF